MYLRKILLEIARQHKTSNLILCVDKWDKKGMGEVYTKS